MGTMTHNAIETVYNGYKFRSRLEAKWAVAFDLHGIGYEYEPEAYSLPSGPYLPDFYIPQWDAFAEVKRGKFTDIERKKCKDLVEATEKRCVLLDGIPTYGPYRVIKLISTKEEDGEETFEIWDDWEFWHVLAYAKSKPNYPYQTLVCDLVKDSGEILEADHPWSVMSRSSICKEAAGYRFWDPSK